MSQTSPEPAPLNFTTNPEAVLRTESALLALHEDRIDDLAQILAVDYADGADPDAPKRMLVALLAMTDSLLAFAVRDGSHTHRGLLREAARVTAKGFYPNPTGKSN